MAWAGGEEEMREYGAKLLELYSADYTQVDQELDLAGVLHVVDAFSVEQITEENSLSANLLSKVKDALAKVEDIKAKDLKSKILRRKNKIRILLKKTHLFEKDVGINLNKDDSADVSTLK
uniref:Uncharacterized protein n=1 Tax=Oryza brachyantha TaxID=4533 RepID=J3LP20_ORYBR